jgi:hypothetical protein
MSKFLIDKYRTEALALIMKYLWENGYDKETVKKAADVWWGMQEKGLLK